MTNAGRIRVAWVVSQRSAAIASTRYRCYYPALALQSLGVESRFYRASAHVIPDLASIDAIVFVKLLDADSARLASMAKNRGAKVFVDLCDNVVVSNYPKAPDLQPTLRLAGISTIADAIVTPSPMLAEAIRPLIAASARLIVIPDQVETEDTFAQAKRMQVEPVAVAGAEHVKPQSKDSFAQAKRLVELVAVTGVDQVKPRSAAGRGMRFFTHALRDPADAMAIFRRKLNTASRGVGRRPMHASNSEGPNSRLILPKVATHQPARPDGGPLEPRKSVLWFGNYGAPHSDFGMLALLLAVPALETVDRDIPLELTVVSNNQELFNRGIAPIGVPTRYVEWSAKAVFDAVKTADVCLLPFGVDPFSVTKSANRAVLALQHGVPVVTTRLSSMEVLAGAVAFDDWEDGLRRFLGPNAAAECAAAIAVARPVLEEYFSSEAIGKAWSTLFREIGPRRRFGYLDGGATREVAVLLQGPEVLDTLLPVIDELRRRPGVLLRILLTPHAMSVSPRVLRAVIERAIVPYALEGDTVLNGEDRILRNFDILLTAAENAFDPECIAPALTRTARALGVATFTIEVGTEHLGRTAAEHILTKADHDGLLNGAAVVVDTLITGHRFGRAASPCDEAARLPAVC